MMSQDHIDDVPSVPASAQYHAAWFGMEDGATRRVNSKLYYLFDKLI
jgi:hypothetical protein